MSNAVIVIDMLRGFLDDACPLYCGPSARSIIPNVVNLLTEEQKKGSSVIFVADYHHPDDLEFESFPPHCLAGTAETEIVPELRQFAASTAIITKRRFSGFFGTSLEATLKAANPEKLIICGVCTDICVLHTAADARNRDYRVEVPVNCVASFDEGAHLWALRHMEKVLGVKLTHKE